ncbi:tetratricopeptide repeat protein [Rhodobacterales bacterium HKCCSP123]|nr:tetratricopeptide repeat protein [Rhodobacterales bacterium HKCCSP123]
MKPTRTVAPSSTTASTGKTQLLAANTLLKQGRVHEARKILDGLVARYPGLAEAWVGLGHIARAEHDHAKALAAFEKALQLRPGNPALMQACAVELIELDHSGRALSIYDRLIAEHPRAVKWRADKAHLLQVMGDFAAAEREFRTALTIAPDDGQLYRMLLATLKLKAGDPLIAQMERTWNKQDLPQRARVDLGFALAKAMEDSGQSDRVFHYLRPANEGMKRLYPYDVAKREQEVADLIALFRVHDFSGLELQPSADFNPVFVTGLPRSGTTLIEQIISSHPAVKGGGELPLFGRAAMRLLIDKTGRYVPLHDIQPQAWANLGASYERTVRKILGDVNHVTDKAMQTYMVLGLLRLALPSSRAIVVQRDPRDTLFSIYKNIFADGMHLYAYDLRDLVRYYRTFQSMVDFWREAMPDGICEITYESVIADPESQGQALMAAAGLQWDPSYLDVSGNERLVKTLSVHQARQPLYSSSIASWKLHENELSEMLDELDR